MSKINKILFILAIIIIVVILVLDLLPGVSKKLGLSGEEKILVNVKIDGFPDSVNVKIKSESTVLDVLKLLNEKNPDINLVTKDYKDMGVLVEGIGANKNGENNKYWQYNVNGELPMIGADKYVLKDKDEVYWVFADIKF